MPHLRAFLALLWKEMLQLMKNPKTRFTVIGPPILQLFLLGYAATMDLKEVPLGVLDHAQTQESRALVAAFAGSPTFTLRAPLRSEADLAQRMDTHAIEVALVIPETFSKDLAQQRPADLQVITDGRNSFSAGIALSYVNTIVNRFAQAHLPGASEALTIITRGWHNPNYSTQFSMIPSLLAILILLSLTILVALSFARERESGTMDQLFLTPYSTFALLAAKGLASVAVGLVELTFCMFFVRYWFQVPYASSYLLLWILFFTFLLAAVGMGLAISVHCANLQQAMVWSFLFAMPVVLLSGISTPVESMPALLQKTTLINPVYWGITALRRLFLEGATFTDVLPTYLILSTIGIGTFASACASLSWQRCH